MSGYFTHWRDTTRSQNSYWLKKVFSETDNRVLCRFFGDFKYNVQQAEVNKWAKQIRELKGVQGVLTEQREELGYLLKMAKAYFARKATEKLYSVISLTHDIDDTRFGSRYQRKLLKITLNKWKIFDRTKKEIMVRLLKLIKSKERCELKITFAQYKQNISQKYLSTQGLVAKIRKLKMQRVFTAWRANVDKQKYKRRLGRKLVRRLRRRLLLEGLNKWVRVIRHMRRGEEEQVEYQQLDQWSHSEDIKRLKLNFFQDQSKQKLELENRKINKQIKYILVNSIERHQRAVCLTYFSKWKDNATVLGRLQHSTSRLDSILKQSELRKAIQIWSSNIQSTKLQKAEMYLELCVKDQSKLTSHLQEKQELRLQSLIPITQKLSQINHDSEAYHKNCYETLKLLWRLKNNFHSKSRLTIAFEKWKNIRQVHHRGAKKLVAVLKHLNLKTAFASIRRDARDEGEIHKFMVTLNKLDSKLNRQKLISAFSQWRSSMFSISTEHRQEYQQMIVDIGGIVQNIHTQLYDKMEQNKMNYLQFNCKRQVFMNWRDFVKGHMALKKANTLAAKAVAKARRAYAIKKWREVTRQNLKRTKAVDQCTSKHKMLLLRKTLVSLRWFKDQNKFLRMTIERSLEIKNKTN